MAIERPNIVTFMVDQLSAKWLEAALAGACEVPNLRRLQDRGVTFNQAYTSNPVCTPARSTLATGLTSRQHGVLQNGYVLDPSIPTYMNLLRDAGYRSGLFGKLHLRPHHAGLYPDYRSYGFDVTEVTEDPRGGAWLDWVKTTQPEHYEAALATIWPSRLPGFREYGPDGIDLSERIERIRSNFQWSIPGFPTGTSGFYALPFPAEMSQTEWITRNALRFIDESKSMPFHVHISYVQPHAPHCAPTEYFEKVRTDNLPEPVQPTWTDDPLHPSLWDRPIPRFMRSIPDNWRADRSAYFADISHLDAQLGLILDSLDRLSLTEKTYVFFLSDHGDMLRDHGMSGKEGKHYDACIRVPLVIAGPGLSKGAQRDAFVQLEDICPTVLEIAGVDVPGAPVEGPHLHDEPEWFPGQSLLSLCVEGDAAGHRQFAYIESYNSLDLVCPDEWARTIRTTRYRYTWYPEQGGEQLFDLQNDPDEQRNLADNNDCTSTRSELRDLLLNAVVLQDYPHPIRGLYALGVH
jgi:arylsulfatase